jgi:PST family polysaccharide transporter
MLGYAVLVVTTDLVLVVILWSATGVPRLRGRIRSLRGLLSFTGNVSATQLTGFVARNADNLLIGKALGDVALGYYMLAYRIMRLPITGLVMVVNRALFPVFASYADDVPRLRRNFLVASRTLGAIALPAMALVVVNAHELVTVLFGDRWGPAVVPTQILAIAAMLQSLTAMMTPALLATGRERAQLHWTLASTVTMLVAFLLTARHGIVAVATAYACVNAIFFPLAIRMLGQAMRFSARDYAGAMAPAVVTAVAAAGCSFVARMSLADAGLNEPVTLVLSGLAGVAGGLLIALTLLRRQLTDQVRLLRQLVSPR